VAIGVVQKPTRQVAQERAQPGYAEERFRRAVQRFHATVRQRALPDVQLHLRHVQRLGLQADQSARVQDVSVESQSGRGGIGRPSSAVHGSFSAADVLRTRHQYVRYVLRKLKPLTLSQYTGAGSPMEGSDVNKIKDQDQDRFFWSDTGLAQRPTVRD